jgi:DNA phosphorothioation system restriction enzyme
MLTNNKYLSIYRSIFNDFDAEFLVPCLKESVKLFRGTGYFSLKSLISCFDGLLKFIKNGGTIQLVCNPQLSGTDIENINKGYELSDSDVIDCLINNYNSAQVTDKENLQLDIICNLISQKKLDIKIAYMPNGVYHEKFGTFIDENNNKVYFNGSANETLNAKKNNFESFVVHTSWNGYEEDIQLELDYFNSLWNDEIVGIKVLEFPKALKDKLFNEYKSSDSLDEAIKKYFLTEPQKEKKLYPYQEMAINEFFNNDCCHFYEMATGTGKTFTSIKTIEKINIKMGHVFTIVCVPQVDLQSQWVDELKKLGFNQVYCFGGMSDAKKTENDFNNAIIKFYTSKESVVCVSVYDTFFSKIYKNCDGLENLFLVFDEAHNLTTNYMNKMPKNTKFKLGLSATITRFDDKETDRIIKYFTNNKVKPFYYGIEDAIANEFLSNYYYHPITVYLDEHDFEKYKKKSKLLAVLQSTEEPDEEEIKRIRNERSLIIKQSSSKILKLEEMIGSYDFKNSVVYCGQGSDEDESIIDKVTMILSAKGNYNVSHFTSKTINRVLVLKEFENSYYDTLVAIKCFDEGVDVPKLDKIYIMASDTSTRQTVQRRGRVLRKCKETGKTVANIYDMVVLPPACEVDCVSSLIISEFKRVIEYNRLALNSKTNNSFIFEILDKYNIEIEDLKNEE